MTIGKNNLKPLETKGDFVELAKRLCDPIFRLYDASASTVALPDRVSALYSDEIADFESFARPLCAAAGIVHNGDIALGHTLFSMIRNGVNPQGSGYWGELSDHDQRAVEMVSVVWFLFVNRQQMREELDDIDMKNLSDWFLQINKISLWNNNWQFFGIIINVSSA